MVMYTCLLGVSIFPLFLQLFSLDFGSVPTVWYFSIFILLENVLENVSVGFMVFNATFNNLLVISWLSVLLVEETGGPGVTTDLPQVIDKLAAGRCKECIGVKPLPRTISRIA